jgi:hypothetical protein
MPWVLELEIKKVLYPERYANGWGGGYGGYLPAGLFPVSLDVYDNSVRNILNVLVSRTINFPSCFSIWQSGTNWFQ